MLSVEKGVMGEPSVAKSGPSNATSPVQNLKSLRKKCLLFRRTVGGVESNEVELFPPFPHSPIAGLAAREERSKMHLPATCPGTSAIEPS